MLQPFQKGVSLFDQAKPIGEILGEISTLLAEVNQGKERVNTPDTEETEDE